MSIEALVFDVDGTLADTEEVHRMAFNLAFEQLGLGWHWSQAEYRALLAITGGKERMKAYVDSLPLGASEKKRLHERVPAIHAAKTQHYTDIARRGGIELRTGVLRFLEEAQRAGLRLAIASTTTAVNIDALLQATLGPRGLDVRRDRLRRPGAREKTRLRHLPAGARHAGRAARARHRHRRLAQWPALGAWCRALDAGHAHLLDRGQRLQRRRPGAAEPGRPHPAAARRARRAPRIAAFLGIDELLQMATVAPPLNAVQALYRENS